MTSLFVGADTAKVLLKLEDYGNLKHLIAYDPLDPETQKELQKRGLEIISFKKLLEEGKSIKDIDNSKVKPTPEDCYTFSYTSGTTGPPKGAMLSHKNMLAFTVSMHRHPSLEIRPTDVYASYLPLPHVMERGVSVALFAFGAHLM
jgi:long-chain acyl-CoA synthetase